MTKYMMEVEWEQVDALVKTELVEAATCNTAKHLDDVKQQKKVRKKVRWLLKNWYMTKEEWDVFNV